MSYSGLAAAVAVVASVLATSKGVSAESSDRQKPSQTLVLLVRHGEREDYVDPSWISKNCEARPWDPPLSAKGHRQAAALPEAIIEYCRQFDLPLGAVYCSPFLRTRQTARPTAERFGLSVTPDPGLMEWLHTSFYTAWACRDSTGSWGSGKLPVLLQFSEVVKQPARTLVGFQHGPTRSMQDPETRSELVKRIWDRIEQLSLKHRGEVIVIVGHCGPIVYPCQLLVDELAPDEELPSFDGRVPLASYTGIYALLREGKDWKLIKANDIRHQKDVG